MKFSCPSCGGHIGYEAELAGQNGTCPHCETQVTIPSETRVQPITRQIKPNQILSVAIFLSLLVAVVAFVDDVKPSEKEIEWTGIASSSLSKANTAHAQMQIIARKIKAAPLESDVSSLAHEYNDLKFTFHQNFDDAEFWLRMAKREAAPRLRKESTQKVIAWASSITAAVLSAFMVSKHLSKLT
jgi:hypothetical protein